MSTEIVRSDDIAGKISWAKALAPAGLLPKAYQQNPANLLLAAELADALGISRINALTSIHVVDGKPTASADLMAALVRRAGHRLRIIDGDGSVTATLIRSDDPDFEYVATWTMADAQRAGLVTKSVWKAYPKAMLRSRAITEVIRKGASEALVGVIYTPEEMGVDVDSQGQPKRPLPITTRVTVAEITTPPVDVTTAIVLDDLDASARADAEWAALGEDA